MFETDYRILQAWDGSDIVIIRPYETTANGRDFPKLTEEELQVLLAMNKAMIEYFRERRGMAY